ncbi:zinc-binding dehydrogenase [Catenulispora rubra]|uniref:zinc-binding dehydrogenase n=1 Tax=Catenulispora rubra TaxID=280293 RepID=UPI0018920E06|nr:zinc-binding dehydrogenase [Catenulispora rubra]
MRVVRVREFGPPAVLRVEEEAEARPGPGQVLVRAELAGVIYGETVVRSGQYPLPLPWIPGTEVGGRVEAVGAGADEELLGRRVVATTLGNVGGYAEYALAKTGNVLPVPDGLAMHSAVAVFQAGAISIGILEAVGFLPGETVLVTAAAGRIGSLLVQLAKTVGAKTVIGAVGSAAKLAAAGDFGADVAVDYSESDWTARVQEATGGRGADVVLDAVGGSVGRQALNAAAYGTGRIGIYGFASGSPTSFDAMKITRRGLSVMGALGKTFAKPAADRRAYAEEALASAAAGRLVPRIHGVFPFERAPDAHTELDERRNIGAVLLRP